MKIALDFDGTFTLDPEFWTDFINLVAKRGHLVYLVTMRHGIPEGIYTSHHCDEYSEVYDELANLPIAQYIFTGRKAKKAFCDDLGLYIDVWIDDNPLWVYQNG